MAIELESEPGLAYAIKYFILHRVNEFNKTKRDKDVERFVRGLLELLFKEKAEIGKLQEHFTSVEGIVVGEYKALLDEFNSKSFNAELVQNFLKISKLFEVLTVFDCEEEKKKNFLMIGKKAQKYAVATKKLLQEQNSPAPQKHASFLSKVPTQQTPDLISNNEQPHGFEQQTLRIQHQNYDSIFAPILTEKAVFTQIAVQVEQNTSLIRNKFRNNLHKVASFEYLKKELSSAKASAENQNLQQTYKKIIGSYNDICANINQIN